MKKSMSLVERGIQIALIAASGFIGALGGVRPVVMVLLAVCFITIGVIEGWDMGIMAAMRYFKREGDRRRDHDDKN